MEKQKIIAIGVGLLAICVAAFLGWYQIHYSMDVAKPFEFGESSAPSRVLVATQGSKFKNAVVDGVVKSFRNRPVFVKVIDVSGLRWVDAGQWDAILVLHTWEKWEPPDVVDAFFVRWRSVDNVIALATSSAGDLKIEGVDAIASASRMTDVSSYVTKLLNRIELLLPKELQAPDLPPSPDH